MKRRKGKSGRLRSRRGRSKSSASRRFNSAAKPTNITIVQKSAPRRSSRPKMRFYSRPKRRARYGKMRRSTFRSRNTGRAAGLIAAGVAAAGLGATIGSLATQAGLLQKAPTQNFTGLAVTGLIGVGLIVIGLFVKSEGLKLLFYGFGGGLLIEELTRQVEMNFYDFRVAYLGAQPLDYSQGISGAQLQLAQLSGASSSPAQLPSSATSSSPSTSSPPSRAADRSLRESATAVLNTIQPQDLSALQFFVINAAQNEPFSNSVAQLLLEKDAIHERQDFRLPQDLLNSLNRLKGDDNTFRNLRTQMQAGRSFVEAVEKMQELGVAGVLDSLGTLRDNIKRLQPAA